jgi:hypothetical protein
MRPRASAGQGASRARCAACVSPRHTAALLTRTPPPRVNREHHRWHSPSLGRDMELLVFGHAGARMLVFPTSMGRFFEWEDRG